MGAYENPPPINFRTTGAGAAWANAAAGIGKNIGNAIIERRKYLDAKLEKENKEMLELTRRRNALAAQGAEKLKANLEKMEGLDEEFKKAYIKEFNQGWRVYTRAQTSTDLDEIESLQPQLKRFNHFKAVSGDQIKNANDYSIKMATFIDQIATDGPGVPNTVDLYYAGNNNLMKAANIETGGITEGESREVIINDKGDAVMRYTFVNEDGKSETFDLDTSELDLDNVLQVPDFNNKVEGTVSNMNIFNEDGTINPSYAPLDENNQPKLEITTEIVDGKKITTQNQVVNTEGIIQAYTDAGMNAMQDMSHAQKVSIWKNTIAPALDPKKDYNEDGKPDGFLPENLAYDSETGQFTDAQQKIFDAGVSAYLGDMARMKVEAATKDSYKRVITEAPKESKVKAPDTFAGEIFADIQEDPAAAYTAVTGKDASYDPTSNKLTTIKYEYDKDTNTNIPVPVVYDLNNPGMVEFLYNSILEANPGYLGGQSGARQSQEMKKLVEKFLKERQEENEFATPAEEQPRSTEEFDRYAESLRNVNRQGE